MDQQEINQGEWSNPTNWRWGVYNSPRDSRVWVAKQIPWTGWTLNFAHSAAWWWMAALLAPAAVGVVIAIIVTSMQP